MSAGPVLAEPDATRPDNPVPIVGFVIAIAIGAALNALPGGVAAGSIWLAVTSARPRKQA